LERFSGSQIFNTISEGILAIDRTMTIRNFNLAASEITGWRREEVIGRKCYEIFCNSLCENLCPVKKIFEKKQPSHFKVVIKSKNGKTLPLSASSMALKDNNDNVIGGLLIFYTQTHFKPSSFGKFYELGLVGASREMMEVSQLIETVAATDSTVLITGPTGTGKNVVAKVIHKLSKRKDGPYVQVNCATLSEALLESELFGHERGAFTGAVATRIGRFEMANGGTVFLDEIGDIGFNFQAKLLRVVEEGEFERVGSSRSIKVDIRLIVATNKDLRRLVSENKFRDDLYYRLNVFNIELPPLKKRKSDLKLLIDYFISEFNKVFGVSKLAVSDAVMNLLAQYDYPGNVRELRNIIEHAFIKSPSHLINVEDLPDYVLKAVAFGPPSPVNGEREDFSPDAGEQEKKKIEETLRKCRGNKAKAARLLGYSRKTLYSKLHKYKML